MRAFLHGAGYLWQGLRLLGQPGLRRWVIVPVLASALACGLLAWGAASTLLPWLDAWLERLPDWLAFLRTPIRIVASAAGLLLLAIGFTLLANLIGSPFNGLLAEAVIRARAPHCLPAAGPGLIQGGVRSAGRETRKLLWIGRRALAVLLLWLASLALAWLPGVNVLLGAASSALWFLFGAWAMSVEYCDYPLDAAGRPFTALQDLLAGQRLRSLGLGAAVAVCAVVPLLNLLVMPAAVCAATLLWLDQQAPAAGDHAKVSPAANRQDSP